MRSSFSYVSTIRPIILLNVGHVNLNKKVQEGDNCFIPIRHGDPHPNLIKEIQFIEVVFGEVVRWVRLFEFCFAWVEILLNHMV